MADTRIQFPLAGGLTVTLKVELVQVGEGQATFRAVDQVIHLRQQRGDELAVRVVRTGTVGVVGQGLLNQQHDQSWVLVSGWVQALLPVVDARRLELERLVPHTNGVHEKLRVVLVPGGMELAVQRERILGGSLAGPGSPVLGVRVSGHPSSWQASVLAAPTTRGPRTKRGIAETPDGTPAGELAPALEQLLRSLTALSGTARLHFASSVIAPLPKNQGDALRVAFPVDSGTAELQHEGQRVPIRPDRLIVNHTIGQAAACQLVEGADVEASDTLDLPLDTVGSATWPEQLTLHLVPEQERYTADQVRRLWVRTQSGWARLGDSVWPRPTARGSRIVVIEDWAHAPGTQARLHLDQSGTHIVSWGQQPARLRVVDPAVSLVATHACRLVDLGAPGADLPPADVAQDRHLWLRTGQLVVPAAAPSPPPLELESDGSRHRLELIGGPSEHWRAPSGLLLDTPLAWSANEPEAGRAPCAGRGLFPLQVHRPFLWPGPGHVHLHETTSTQVSRSGRPLRGLDRGQLGLEIDAQRRTFSDRFAVAALDEAYAQVARSLVPSDETARVDVNSTYVLSHRNDGSPRHYSHIDAIEGEYAPAPPPSFEVVHKAKLPAAEVRELVLGEHRLDLQLAVQTDPVSGYERWHLGDTRGGDPRLILALRPLSLRHRGERIEITVGIGSEPPRLDVPSGVLVLDLRPGKLMGQPVWELAPRMRGRVFLPWSVAGGSRRDRVAGLVVEDLELTHDEALVARPRRVWLAHGSSTSRYTLQIESSKVGLEDHDGYPRLRVMPHAGGGAAEWPTYEWDEGPTLRVLHPIHGLVLVEHLTGSDERLQAHRVAPDGSAGDVLPGPQIIERGVRVFVSWSGHAELDDVVEVVPGLGLSAVRHVHLELSRTSRGQLTPHSGLIDATLAQLGRMVAQGATQARLLWTERGLQARLDGSWRADQTLVGSPAGPVRLLCRVTLAGVRVPISNDRLEPGHEVPALLQLSFVPPRSAQSEGQGDDGPPDPVPVPRRTWTHPVCTVVRFTDNAEVRISAVLALARAKRTMGGERRRRGMLRFLRRPGGGLRNSSGWVVNLDLRSHRSEARIQVEAWDAVQIITQPPSLLEPPTSPLDLVRTELSEEVAVRVVGPGLPSNAIASAVLVRPDPDQPHVQAWKSATFDLPEVAHQATDPGWVSLYVFQDDLVLLHRFDDGVKNPHSVAAHVLAAARWPGEALLVRLEDSVEVWELVDSTSVNHLVELTWLGEASGLLAAMPAPEPQTPTAHASSAIAGAGPGLQLAFAEPHRSVGAPSEISAVFTFPSVRTEQPSARDRFQLQTQQTVPFLRDRTDRDRTSWEPALAHQVVRPAQRSRWAWLVGSDQDARPARAPADPHSLPFLPGRLALRGTSARPGELVDVQAGIARIDPEGNQHVGVSRVGRVRSERARDGREHLFVEQTETAPHGSRVGHQVTFTRTHRDTVDASAHPLVLVRHGPERVAARPGEPIRYWAWSLQELPDRPESSWLVFQLRLTGEGSGTDLGPVQIRTGASSKTYEDVAPLRAGIWILAEGLSGGTADDPRAMDFEITLPPGTDQPPPPFGSALVDPSLEVSVLWARGQASPPTIGPRQPEATRPSWRAGGDLHPLRISQQARSAVTSESLVGIVRNHVGPHPRRLMAYGPERPQAWRPRLDLVRRKVSWSRSGEQTVYSLRAPGMDARFEVFTLSPDGSVSWG